MHFSIQQSCKGYHPSAEIWIAFAWSTNTSHTLVLLRSKHRASFARNCASDLGGGYRKRPAKMSWSMPCRLQRWWTNLLLKLLWSQQLWGRKQLEHRVLLVLQKKHHLQNVLAAWTWLSMRMRRPSWSQLLGKGVAMLLLVCRVNWITLQLPHVTRAALHCLVGGVTISRSFRFLRSVLRGTSQRRLAQQPASVLSRTRPLSKL